MSYLCREKKEIHMKGKVGENEEKAKQSRKKNCTHKISNCGHIYAFIKNYIYVIYVYIHLNTLF